MPDDETTTTTTVPEAPVSLAAAFKQAAAAKANPAPAPKPELVATPTPEPKVVETPPAKPESPIKKLEEVADDEPGFKLPIDDEPEEPAEAVEADPEKPGDKRDPAGRRIEALKKEIKETYAPRISQLESELNQAKAQLAESAAFLAEREELKQAVERYEKEFSVVKLEKTDAFVKSVREPLQAIEAGARKLAGKYSLDESKVFEAFTIPDEDKRNDALTNLISGLELSQPDAFKLFKLAEDVQPVFAREAELYANADAALAELEAKDSEAKASQIAARADERRKTTDLVANRIAAKLPFLKDFVDEVVGPVKDLDFDAQSVPDQAYNAMVGKMLPKIITSYKALEKERDNLLDELSQRDRVKPKVGGDPNPAAPVGEAPKSLASAVRQSMGR